MNSDKRSKTLYWAVTLLFILAMTFGGMEELVGVKQAVAGTMQLGYPRYLLPFLGVAKLLGVAAILVGRPWRLKEWAYAGFTFDLLGASYSHFSMGQPKEAAAPLMIGLVGAASYALWRRQSDAASKRAAEAGVQERLTTVFKQKEA